MGVRTTLRRYHVWLGWLVALPFLFWTVSGLVMVAKPIEEVRGTALIAEPKPLALVPGMVVPRIEGRAISSLTLEQRAAGPRWVVDFADGTTRLADPLTGTLLPALGAVDAAREVSARYTGAAKVIADAKTDRVLGVWCIASVAGTMIAQAAQAMEFGATSEDIAYTCHAHPTHSEAIKEAAMAVTGKPIHI